jgi:hypothetical protein
LRRVIEMVEHWPIGVLGIFVSYLLGSIPRSFYVDLTDRLCLRFHRLTPRFAQRKDANVDAARRRWRDAILEGRLPYCAALRLVLNRLVAQRAFPEALKSFPVPDERTGGASRDCRLLGDRFVHACV